MKTTQAVPKTAHKATVPDDTIALTVPEAARQLRVGINTVYRLIASGDLKAKDVRRKGSKKGMTRIARAELVRYMTNAPAATSQIDAYATAP